MSRIKVGHKDGRGIWRDEGPSNGVLRASTAIRGVLVVGYTPKPVTAAKVFVQVGTPCAVQTRSGPCARGAGHKKSHTTRAAMDVQNVRHKQRRSRTA